MVKLLFCALILASTAWANARAQGWCEQGGHPVVVSASTNSISTVQISYPQCVVTVFVTGTQTLASLFSNNSGTVLSNPFTADVFGHWFFYAANGRYDVQISGAGLAAPYTFGDIFLSDASGGGGGGSGTVNPGTGGQITYYAGTGNTVSGATVVGAVKAGSPPTQAACSDLVVPCITENQTVTLSGDTTGSGKTSIVTTTGKVNGIAYSATAAAHSVEIITTANTTATAKVIPDCQDSGGNHLNFTQSSDTITCGNTSSGGGGGGGSLPFVTTLASSTQLTVGGSGAFGCNGVNTLIGGGSATIVPLSGTASEQLNIGISCADLRLKLIAPSNTFTCTTGPFSGCDTVVGSNFTDGIIPLSGVTMSTDGAGSFTFTAVSDFRAPFQDDPLTAGTGIVYTKSGSTRTVAVDSTQIPLLSAVNTYTNQATPGAAPASGFTEVYPKSGSGLCSLDSSNVERCTGGGGSGTVNSGTAGQIAYYAATGAAVSGATVTGAVKAGNPPTQAACADLAVPCITGNQTITLSGDTTGSGTTAITTNTVKLNGIAYSSTAAAHSVEVITTPDTTATAKVIPDCQDSAGNHLNYTQSSDAFGCGTSATQIHSITFVVDGQGSVPATGDLQKFPIAEFSCTINRVDVTANASGSMTMDIWKRAARAIPTSADKISASDPATLSSAQASTDATLTGWTLPVVPGDTFGATLVTVSTLNSATVQIWCQ